MQALANSVLLQSLGYAIIHSLWQVALLWTAYNIITNVLQLSAKTKYTLAVTAQIASFAWFIFTFSFYYIQCSEAIKQTNFSFTDNSNIVFVNYEVNNFRSFLLNLMIVAEKFLPYLSVAYLLLLVVLFVRWNQCYFNTQSFKKNGLSKIDVHWKLFVKETAVLLGIKKEVKIFLSEKITTPLTIGFLKPIILIPLASINHLSETQMEAVLLHELAHIKRMDYLLNIFLSVIEIVLFFNPFTKSINAFIQKERENCCDDWVLQFQYNPTVYAEALLKVALLHFGNSSLTMNAVNNKNSLLERVRRMTKETNQSSFNFKKQITALLLISFVVVSISWLLPKYNNIHHSKNYSTLSNIERKDEVYVYVKPMTAKISNPLFNPLFFFKKPLQEEINRNIVIAEQKTGVKNIAEQTKPYSTTQSIVQATNANIATMVDGIGFDDNRTIISTNIDSTQHNTESLNIGKKVLWVQGKKITFDSSLAYWNDKLNQFNWLFKNKYFVHSKEDDTKEKNMFQHFFSRAEILKHKSDSLRFVVKQTKKKKVIVQGFNDDEFYTDENDATAFPVHYALNVLQDSALQNLSTSVSYEDEVMVIKIKKKQQNIEENENTSTQKKDPKRYDIVVSNPGQPDKSIIVEVW